MTEESKEAVEPKEIKKKYEKPSIETEKLNTYGASCNGTTNAGRKASAAPPDSCRSNRLNS